MAKKDAKIWILSTLTFASLIHTIDASVAFLSNNQPQLLKIYPLIGEYLTQVPNAIYFYALVAITLAVWGLTCVVAFNNPLETFLSKTLMDAQEQNEAENQLVEEHNNFFDLMYETMEESKKELGHTNDLVRSLRCEIKDVQKMKETFEMTRAELVGLKRQVGMLEEKLIFPLLCKTCGKPLRADFSICPYCGSEINKKHEAVVLEPNLLP